MPRPRLWSTPSRRGWSRPSPPTWASRSKTRTAIRSRRADGDLAQRDLKPLHDFRAGQRVVIREVQDDNPDRLRRWQSLGLIPGPRVLLSYQPLDDLFDLQVGSRASTSAAKAWPACAANWRRAILRSLTRMIYRRDRGERGEKNGRDVAESSVKQECYARIGQSFNATHCSMGFSALSAISAVANFPAVVRGRLRRRSACQAGSPQIGGELTAVTPFGNRSYSANTRADGSSTLPCAGSAASMQPRRPPSPSSKTGG